LATPFTRRPSSPTPQPPSPPQLVPVQRVSTSRPILKPSPSPPSHYIALVSFSVSVTQTSSRCVGGVASEVERFVSVKHHLRAKTGKKSVRRLSGTPCSTWAGTDRSFFSFAVRRENCQGANGRLSLTVFGSDRFSRGEDHAYHDEGDCVRNAEKTAVFRR